MAKMEHEGQLALSKSSCFPISVAMIGTIVCYLFFLHSLNILGHLVIGTSHQPVSSPMQEEKGSYGTWCSETANSHLPPLAMIHDYLVQALKL